MEMNLHVIQILGKELNTHRHTHAHNRNPPTPQKYRTIEFNMNYTANDIIITTHNPKKITHPAQLCYIVKPILDSGSIVSYVANPIGYGRSMHSNAVYIQTKTQSICPTFRLFLKIINKTHTQEILYLVLNSFELLFGKQKCTKRQTHATHPHNIPSPVRRRAYF